MKSYLITGGNRGIGLGLINQLLQDENNLVFTTVRKSANLDDLNALKTSKLHILFSDITNEQEVDDSFREISKITDSLDIVILNAGYVNAQIDNPLDLTKSKETWNNFLKETDVTFKVNTFAQIYFANKFIPLIENSKEKKLIFVTSGLAHYDWVKRSRLDFHIPYSMSKAAVTILVPKYGAVLRSKGITVLGLCPGVVNSNLLDDKQIDENYGIFYDGFKRVNPDYDGVMSVETGSKKFLKAVDFFNLFHSGSFISSNGTSDSFV